MLRSFEKDIRNFIKSLGGSIGIRLLVSSEADASIYGENKHKIYSFPISLPAFIVVNPSEEIATEAGMDKERTEIIAKVSREALLSKGLINPSGILRVTQDDILVFNGVTYAITKITPSVNFGTHHIFSFGAFRV